MPTKFLLLGGGGVLGFLKGGGGSANFIFMGVGIFPNRVLCLMLAGPRRGNMHPSKAHHPV